MSYYIGFLAKTRSLLSSPNVSLIRYASLLRLTPPSSSSLLTAKSVDFISKRHLSSQNNLHLTSTMTLAQSLSNNTNNSKTSNSSNNSKNSPVTSTSFSAAPSLSNTNTSKISALQFEKIANTYLEDLNEYFDSVMDDLDDIGADYDVTNLNGVLTINLGKNGTYVINKQSPNQQIWLSSPKSGPKRYDFNMSTNEWVYSHDQVALHTLLSKELSQILSRSIQVPAPQSFQSIVGN